jgi:hypothetical protein
MKSFACYICKLKVLAIVLAVVLVISSSCRRLFLLSAVDAIGSLL